MISADHSKRDEFDRFLWITWNPFRADSWHTLHTAEVVEDVVAKRAAKVTNDEVPPSRDICELVAARVQVVVLSEAVETLVPTSTQRWLAAHH